MHADTRLVVSVRMYSGTALPRATVTLISSRRGPTRLIYDPDRRVYYTEGHPPDEYRLLVEAPRLFEEEREIVLTVGHNYEVFYLAPPGTPFFHRGSVRIPFKPLPGLIGVALTKHPTEEEEKDLNEFAGRLGFGPVQVPQTVRDERARVFKAAMDDLLNLAEFETHPLIRRAGPAIRFQGNALSFLTNELVVKFDPHVSDLMSDAILEQFGLRKIRAIPYAQNAFLVYRPGPASLELLDIAEQLRGNDANAVIYAEPNLVTTAIDAQVPPQDFLYGEQWAMGHAEFDAAWARLEGFDSATAYGDPSVLIAIMDRGMESDAENLYADPLHPDFDGTVSDSQSKVDRFFNFADMAYGNTDVGGNIFPHGMWVSGVAAALANNPVSPYAKQREGISGAAPNCRVISLMRGEGRDESDYADAFIWTAGFDPGWMADGIDYETTDVLPPVVTPGADIINNSYELGWGVPASIMKDALDFVAAFGRDGRGTIMVFAAGNELDDVSSRAPLAAYRRTLGVAASTTGGTDATYDIRTDYSNFGDGLDVCAPSGEKITGPDKPIVTTDRVGFGNIPGHDGGGNDYKSDGSGTSMAAPLVSALAALMLSRNPDLTWVQVRDILRETAVRTLPGGSPLPNGDWSGKYSPYYGYGRINALDAVDDANDLVGADHTTVADTWIKENSTDVGDVPSLPPYSEDVWVRNLRPILDPGPKTEHQDPIRGQDNWVYANIRNRGAQDSGEVYARLLITRWAGTQYVYPDDFIPVVTPSENPTSPDQMAPGSYLIGESILELVPAGGSIRVNSKWPKEIIPPEEVTIDGVTYSWADSCLLVDVTPHDGPPPSGNLTSDINNVCQRNITIVDATGASDAAVLFIVGHATNLMTNLDLDVVRRPLPSSVRLYVDYVDPGTTIGVRRMLAAGWLRRYGLTRVTRGSRTIFELPTRTRVAAPIVRAPRQYQYMAVVAEGLKQLAPGNYRFDVIQRVPGGAIQGLLRFVVIKNSP